MTSPPLQFVFGPFRFQPARQVLLAHGQPVRLGGRARDILATLLERPGQVVRKQDLTARVWPGAVVEEANLRVHVAALRKALAEADGTEARYISNVAGRGYCFVGEVVVTEDRPAEPAARDPPRATPPLATPPLAAPPLAATTRILGREAIVRAVAAGLLEHRFATLAGPGGIGKTTVALAVADALGGAFRDGIHLVDLAPLADPALVPTALAAALGVAVVSDQPGRGLAAVLRDRHLLILLDNCEHVIEAAAILAETAFQAGEGVHILATSREPLGADGEHVHRLPPLTTPPDAPGLTAAAALDFPAVQLFAERARARLGSFALADADAPLVAEICRRLDGIALAIEIAAGWVDAFGIAGLAARLDDRFRLQMRGRRTALPRHRTLFTTLDWSHALLSARERAVLRRLTVFAGIFTLDAAVAVLEDEDHEAMDIIEAVAGLVGKSLIAASIDGAVAQYRLLETTRAYAAQRLAESGEQPALARRHALRCRDLLRAGQTAWETLPAAAWLEAHRALVDDVRAALDWSFGPAGDPGLGVALTIASVPLWFQLSLISECHARARRARATLPPAMSDMSDADIDAAMRLDAAIAWSLMQIRGFVAETRAAWTRVLDGAERLSDPDHQLRALWGLWAGRINHGDLTGALALARRFQDVAARQSDRDDRFVGDRMLGWTLHLLGDQPEARVHIDRMLAGYTVPVTGARIIRFVFDQRLTARSFLARILWLRGLPDQAMRTVRMVIDDATDSRDALSLCQALVQAACPLALLTGDLHEAERFVTLLHDQATRHGFDFWQTWARGFRGLLLVRRGETKAGQRLLEAAIGELRGIEFGVHYTAFLAGQAEGLARAGDTDRAMAAIDEALARSERNGERWCVADLLRIRGELDLAHGATAAAETRFTEALDWARRQGALAWELRVAIRLARLWHATGRAAEARALLADTHGRFTEGFGTEDLMAARALLNEWG